MKPRLFLLASCLVLVSSLVMKASGPASSRTSRFTRRRGVRAAAAVLRRRAVRRRGARPLALLRPRSCTASEGTAARASTVTWRRTTSSSRRPAPRPGSGCCSCGAGSIRMPTIPCSARSTRTTSGPTATTPATSATCGRTASSGSRSRCPSNIRLIDPATNAPSTETSVDVWRWCRRSTTWS